MRVEDFFDLRIATLAPGEEPPPDAHIARIEEPPPEEVARRTAQGWFYKPLWVTYSIDVPRSLDEYIERTFRSRTRNKPRKLLREVPRRYRLEVDRDGNRLDQFRELYRRTVVARPRGKDRLGEHESGLGPGWWGWYLYDGEAMAAGVLVHTTRRHLSVAYGAFDPEHRRRYDLEHFLLMQVLQRSMELGHRSMSLGMDTNRYGHHLSLHLPAYKLRIGFAPAPYEPGGRELALFRRFDVFEEGLFFYAFDSEAFVAHYFTRGPADLRPFQHDTAPPIRVHAISP